MARSSSKAIISSRGPWRRFTWRHLTLKVRLTTNVIEKGWSRLEIAVVNPEGAPCPLTLTGYRSHYLNHTDVTAAGGPIPYALAWLDHEATSARWIKADLRWRQLDLFD